jgi:diguanylate cyclase
MVSGLRSAWATRLLGKDPKQQLRLLQAVMALALALCCAANLHYLAWAGMASMRWVTVWTLVAMAGFVLAIAVIRTGRNLAYRDPSLTLPQMGHALWCGAAAYALAGAGRGGIFPLVMVVFMFGMHTLTPRQIRRIGFVAIALFGATMLLMSRLRPGDHPAAVEWSHFFMLAIMVSTVAALTGQLSDMRERLRRQQKDIAAAMARIQDLATRDELTGLINRRHMVELLEQELQRGVRSGQTFCVALIDVDDLARHLASHSEPFRDRFLQCLAREATSAIRISDLLARWDEERLLLMLSDSRTPMARLSIERLRERMRLLHVEPGGPPLAATFSVGVAEHRAGEPVAQTIERAEQALQAAHQAGGNRVMLA